MPVLHPCGHVPFQKSSYECHYLKSGALAFFGFFKIILSVWVIHNEQAHDRELRMLCKEHKDNCGCEILFNSHAHC